MRSQHLLLEYNDVVAGMFAAHTHSLMVAGVFAARSMLLLQHNSHGGSNGGLEQEIKVADCPRIRGCELHVGDQRFIEVVGVGPVPVKARHTK